MKSLAALVSAFVLSLAAGAAAAPLRFDLCVSANDAGNCAAGSAQLGATVDALGGSQIVFTFTNTGAAALSITDIYFDDAGSLLGIAAIANGSGVSFSDGASPGNLPAGNGATPAFVATFGADSNAPVQPNGVNPGETVAITFNLQSGTSFQDVLAELADGRLRVGLHVQGFANGGSESFVNTPLPEPSTLALLAAALIGLARVGRRRA